MHNTALRITGMQVFLAVPFLFELRTLLDWYAMSHAC